MKIETLESNTNKSEVNPRVVSEAEWLVARKDLLTREKELTRLRDEVSRHRRELPWIKVEKEYIFDGPDGKETLADLFEDRSQLIVYHFMFAPGWVEGCKSCSYLADHFDGANWHLPHRDVTFVVSSRAPCPNSKRTKSAWAGGSNGCRRTATISISTITSRPQRRKRRRERCSTTIEQMS